MNKYQNILLVLFITLNSLFITSCMGTFTSEYKLDLSEFPTKFIDHFPSKLPRNYIIKKNNDVTNECISYILIDIKDENIDIEKPYLESYSAIDSNLITVKRDIVMSRTWGNQKKIYYKDTDTISEGITYYPLPYFEQVDSMLLKGIQIYSEKTISGLTADFDIYIYDFDKGNYWPNLKPLDYMPKSWENGYSRGVCINEKKGIIIYWIIIW